MKIWLFSTILCVVIAIIACFIPQLALIGWFAASLLSYFLFLVEVAVDRAIRKSSEVPNDSQLSTKNSQPPQ